MPENETTWFPKMRESIVDSLKNTAGYHSSHLLYNERDRGNARPRTLREMGEKANRRATLIQAAQGPLPFVLPSRQLVLGNTDWHDSCPGCVNHFKPGAPAEHPSDTLAWRRIPATQRRPA